MLMFIYDQDLRLIAMTPWKKELKGFFDAVVTDLGLILSFGPLDLTVKVGH